MLNLFQKNITQKYNFWRVRNVPVYHNPTSEELRQIENDLINLGIEFLDYRPNPEDFVNFKSSGYFPSNYHGGIDGGVWDEKILEHYIAFDLLGLEHYQPDDIYVDVAAASSPWAKTLRDKFGVSSFAIDLNQVGENYKNLSYYRIENATATTFKTNSVKGVSLQCAYEMFINNDDINFIHEVARILKPGGKVVISPLYMHTHYCAYSTPEYYGKGYSDIEAKEYVRLDCSGVPSSRKYDAFQLNKRLLIKLKNCNMEYKLYALRNKSELGQNVYCHFILEIRKPNPTQ
ncbi:MAG: methyltransferase domain-containing protein [Sphaerospermopsis sp.]|nr:methyltransferase domain-containing protein [Sphaerospermopsis sp.]